MIAGAWFLSKTWIIRERLGTPLVPYLFAASGMFTVVSGASAVVLAVSVPDTTGSASLIDTGGYLNTLAGLRWVTGKLGFAAAGLALLTAARYQWRVGGYLKRIAPVSAVIGFTMQFIWIDSATILHPIVGTLFFVWLLVIGVMLATGRVEWHFRTMLQASAERATTDSIR